MSDFIALVVKCRKNLSRRRMDPALTQIIALSKEDEEAICQLEYTLRRFGCDLESLLGTGIPPESKE